MKKKKKKRKETIRVKIVSKKQCKGVISGRIMNDVSPTRPLVLEDKVCWSTRQTFPRTIISDWNWFVIRIKTQRKKEKERKIKKKKYSNIIHDLKRDRLPKNLEPNKRDRDLF